MGILRDKKEKESKTPSVFQRLATARPETTQGSRSSSLLKTGGAPGPQRMGTSRDHVPGSIDNKDSRVSGPAQTQSKLNMFSEEPLKEIELFI